MGEVVCVHSSSGLNTVELIAFNNTEQVIHCLLLSSFEYNLGDIL